jgi:dTDP-4-dehydrorhamnose 3,5-epimerase
MKLIETPIAGAFLIEPDLLEDERGFFARIFDRGELESHGLAADFVQWSISFNARRGTLRGLHYQAAPHEEVKLVRCTRGSIHDVMVDLKSGRWFAAELTDNNRRTAYIPRGVAHGFQALSDDCEVAYAISEAYRPELARGVRWNDPRLAIEWPIAAPILSERDRTLPLLSEAIRS